MNGWKEIEYENPNYNIDGDNRQTLKKYVMVGNGFIFNGHSTNDILENAKLILVSKGSINDVSGTTSSRMSTGNSIYRMNDSEYGVTRNNLNFSYNIVKNDGSKFSESEQEIVETWLTSVDHSTELIVFNCNYNENDNSEENNANIKAIYNGLFTSTVWHTIENGFWGLNFTFECNSPYPIKKYTSEKFVIDNIDENNPTELNINCLSDEEIKYVYPTIIISSNVTVDDSDGRKINFKLRNETDNNNTMQIHLLAKDLEMYFDCDNCMVTDEVMLEHYSFSSFMWDEIDNIYWLRLKRGNNKLLVNGQCTIQFKYTYPVKMAGGWL